MKQNQKRQPKKSPKAQKPKRKNHYKPMSLSFKGALALGVDSEEMEQYIREEIVNTYVERQIKVALDKERDYLLKIIKTNRERGYEKSTILDGIKTELMFPKLRL